jgi:hypothetical protein
VGAAGELRVMLKIAIIVGSTRPGRNLDEGLPVRSLDGMRVWK